MRRPKVLIIDDEPGITLLCERLLSKAGYLVKPLTDPAVAIELLKNERFDLLLVDIRMPEISGFDVMQIARQAQPELAILAMTGYGTVETAIQALRSGVDGLILKPFEKDELILTVEQALIDSQKKQDAARVQALRPLFSVTETFLSETRPEFLLEIILDSVSAQLLATNVGFYQVDDKENHVKLVAGRGKCLPGGLINLTGDAISRAATLDTPVWGNNDELINMKLSSLMCVPTTLTNIRSVLYVAREESEVRFRESDLEMFLILSRQATIAMENAKLYGELRAYVKRIEDSQQALVQAEKLAVAGRLTASIAHEINNPLQGVRNCFHLATRDDIPTEMRQKYLDMTQQELERLMTTVQRMLDFYRPSAEFQPVQVLDLLEHVLNLLDQQLRERNIRVTTSWPAILPSVRAISNQIEQVFINLILNAHDAMKDGGELWISISQKKKMLEITFQDSGLGVPDNMKQNIFEPFVSTKGTSGLGLSVSYDIVTAHGGRLDLLNERTPGACFRVLLPINQIREKN